MKRLSIAALFAAIAVFVAVVALRQNPAQPLDASPANAQPSPSDVQKAAAFRRQITDDPRAPKVSPKGYDVRSEEHTSELQSLMRISYAVFCLKKKNKKLQTQSTNTLASQSKKETLRKVEQTR